MTGRAARDAPGSGGPEPTGLDRIHLALAAAPEDSGLQRAQAACLAGSMLWLWLEEAPQADALRPLLIATDDGPVAAAYDREERLAEAAGGKAAHHAALPGRVLLQWLAGWRDANGAGVSLGLNLGCDAPPYVLPAGAVAWAAELVAACAPVAVADGPPILAAPPDPVPAGLERALADVLSCSAGLVASAHLVRTVRPDGGSAPMLVLAGVPPAAQPALARALAEAAALAGDPAAAADRAQAAGPFDLMFAPVGSSAAARSAAVGRRLPVPPPLVPASPMPMSPVPDPSADRAPAPAGPARPTRRTLG